MLCAWYVTVLVIRELSVVAAKKTPSGEVWVTRTLMTLAKDTHPQLEFCRNTTGCPVVSEVEQNSPGKSDETRQEVAVRERLESLGMENTRTRHRRQQLKGSQAPHTPHPHDIHIRP